MNQNEEQERGQTIDELFSLLQEELEEQEREHQEMERERERILREKEREKELRRKPSKKAEKLIDYRTLTPQEIKKELEKHVVGQEEACRQTAIMMYQHLQGHRFVGMLAGPTGSGKSFMTETLQRVFPDIVYLREVSNVTNEGWTGLKKVSTLFKDVHCPVDYLGEIYPLVVFDECDKLFAPKISSNGENVSESLQAEFLSVIHGSIVEYKDNDGRVRKVDTRPISFLFAGAFEKSARTIAERESGSAFGFGATGKKVQSYGRELTREDIREAGCIAEMCGRIQKIICLNKLEADHFRRILDERTKGPVFELENEFKLRFHLSEAIKDEIAHEAYVSGLGIRGIKNQLRNYIDEAIWEDCHTKTVEVG